MKTFSLFVVLILVVAHAYGRTCALSKEFHVGRPQVLSGIFKDSTQLPLPGLEVELLSSGKIVQQLATDNAGHYNFGTVGPGKYRIRIKHGNDDFCAPKIKCNQQGCKIGTEVVVNPKNEITVQLD